MMSFFSPFRSWPWTLQAFTLAVAEMIEAQADERFAAEAVFEMPPLCDLLERLSGDY